MKYCDDCSHLAVCIKLIQATQPIMDCGYKSSPAPLVEAVKRAIDVISQWPCIQHCYKGGIQISEDEVQQCQFCDERNRLIAELEQALNGEGGK